MSYLFLVFGFWFLVFGFWFFREFWVSVSDRVVCYFIIVSALRQCSSRCRWNRRWRRLLHRSRRRRPALRHRFVTFATVPIGNRVMFRRSSARCQVVEIPSDSLRIRQDRYHLTYSSRQHFWNIRKKYKNYKNLNHVISVTRKWRLYVTANSIAARRQSNLEWPLVCVQGQAGTSCLGNPPIDMCRQLADFSVTLDLEINDLVPCADWN